jgi:hypothetical protein
MQIWFFMHVILSSTCTLKVYYGRGDAHQEIRRFCEPRFLFLCSLALPVKWRGNARTVLISVSDEHFSCRKYFSEWRREKTSCVARFNALLNGSSHTHAPDGYVCIGAVEQGSKKCAIVCSLEFVCRARRAARKNL